MSEIAEKAIELAKVIEGSAEYLRFREAKAKLAQNTAAQIMYSDFQAMRRDLEQMLLTGESVPQQKQEELREKQELIMFNEDIRELVMAEVGLGSVLVEVQQILAEHLKLIEPNTDKDVN